MKGFIGHIIDRHANTDSVISPRLSGKFESGNIGAKAFPADNFVAGRISHINNGRFETPRAAEPDYESDNEKAVPIKKIFTSNIETGNDIENRNAVRDNSISHPPTVYPDIVPAAKDQISNELTLKKENSSQYTTPENMHAGNNIIDTREISSAFSLNEQTKKINQPMTGSSVTIPGINKPLLNEEKPVNSGHEVRLNNPGQSSFKLSGIQNNNIMPRIDFAGIKQQSVTLPVIRISIGRIEVRAISPSSPVKGSGNNAQKPNMSLDDYLKKRNSNAR